MFKWRPHDEPNPKQPAVAMAALTPDEAQVTALVDMGCSVGGALAAVYQTRNRGVAAAMEHYQERADDYQFLVEPADAVRMRLVSTVS